MPPQQISTAEADASAARLISMPDMKLSVRQTFGIDSDLEVTCVQPG